MEDRSVIQWDKDDLESLGLKVDVLAGHVDHGTTLFSKYTATL